MVLLGSTSGSGHLVADGHDIGRVVYSLYAYRPSSRTSIIGTLLAKSELLAAASNAATQELRLENGCIVSIGLDGQDGDIAAITCFGEIPGMADIAATTTCSARRSLRELARLDKREEDHASGVAARNRS